MFERREEPLGTYQAKTALGIDIIVTRMLVTHSVVVDRGASVNVRGIDWFIESADWSPHTVGTIKAPPEQAKTLRDQISFAFVVAPKEPYWVSVSSSATAPPTAARPFSIIGKTEIMFGDVQCALVLDGSDRVIASYVTR